MSIAVSSSMSVLWTLRRRSGVVACCHCAWLAERDRFAVCFWDSVLVPLLGRVAGWYGGPSQHSGDAVWLALDVGCIEVLAQVQGSMRNLAFAWSGWTF